MNYQIQELISEQAIKEKVKELGKIIAKDYENKPLLMIGILKGSVIFISDLVREIPFSVDISFLMVSSYINDTKSSGTVRLLYDLDTPVTGKDVLIVEDIVDSGNTVKYIKDMLLLKQPNSLKICALLDKPSRRVTEIKADYIGFQINDEFVVGYGLDYSSKYRNLPHIATINFEEE